MNPSPWLRESRDAIAAAATHGPVVDLACGRGRNALALARSGTPVIGIDRNRGFLAQLRAEAIAEQLAVQCVLADLEADPGFPLAPGSCAAILVFRFLFRPLSAQLVQALQPGGLLVYETFTRDHRQFGYGPQSDAFLLEAGELPRLFPQLEIEASWEGVSEAGRRPEAVARLRARRR